MSHLNRIPAIPARQVCIALITAILFCYEVPSCVAREQHVIIDKIIIKGNSRTKTDIILRELCFDEKERVSLDLLSGLLTQSKSNLLNTGLFNFVSLNYLKKTEELVNIRITLTERWYIWPYPIFEHADRNLANFLHDKDWSRINYGLSFQDNNFRGRAELLKTKIRFGFKEQYGFTYYRPYVDRNKKFGFWTDIDFFRQQKIAVQTINNKLEYMHSDQYLWSTLRFRLSLIYRPGIHLRHMFNFSMWKSSVDPMVTERNPDFFSSGNIEAFMPRFSYVLSYSDLDYNVYPQSGKSLYLKLTKAGIIPTDRNPYNYTYVTGNCKLYKKASHDVSLGSKFGFSKLFGENSSYFFQESFGYTDNIRGFEYYVIDGASYAFMRNEIKLAIIRDYRFSLPFITNESFSKSYFSIYLKPFLDMAYVWNPLNVGVENKLAEKTLLSAGFCIDLVSYYDKVLGLQFFMDNFGSSGIYLNFISRLRDPVDM